MGFFKDVSFLGSGLGFRVGLGLSQSYASSLEFIPAATQQAEASFKETAVR